MSERVRAPEINTSRQVRAPEVAEPSEARPNERKVSKRLRAPEARKSSRYIPVATRRATIERSGRQCEFVDSLTKRRCSSRFLPQYDHIHLYSRGGGSEPSNIRHLCASHNRYEAIRILGATRMRPRKNP
jgi:5-methylcytosine-specific restriction endonuclease McrA